MTDETENQKSTMSKLLEVVGIYSETTRWIMSELLDIKTMIKQLKAWETEKGKNFIQFMEWMKGRNFTYAKDIMAKFNLSRPTACRWMAQMAEADDRFSLDTKSQTWALYKNKEVGVSNRGRS